MAEQSAIQVTTTEDGPVRRTLQVEIPPERVSRAFEHVFRDLAKHARVKGFRPGKVPRSVVQKLYGGTVVEEVERLLVSESLEEAVGRSGVQPVVEPTIDAPPPVQGQPFSYRVGLEVKPEFSLGELRGLPGRKPKLEVGEEDVERELGVLRQRHALLVEEPEDVVAARGHVLTIDFTGRIAGEPFEGGSARGHELELGAGRLVPGFEEQLEGARAGSDVVVRVTFPEDYGNAELAGREASFDVHVTAIRRRELPELDDEFAKDLGEFESLAALRERIQKDLAANAEQRARAALERSVMDALVARTPFEVGPGLVDRQLRSRLSSAHRQLEASVPHDALHEQLARWQEDWRPQAEREVRETLLLEAVAREQGLAVDDAELEARIEAIAARQGADARKVRRAYEERGLLDGLRAQLLEEKALAWLCAEAKVEEVPEG